MPETLSTLRVGFGARVPETGIPLAHINIPSPEVKRDVVVVDSAEHSPYNIFGVSTRFTSGAATMSIENSTLGMAVTGVVTFNKVADSTFENGITSWTGSTGITAETTGGRTSLNSTYESHTTDAPAFSQPGYEEYCLKGDWNETSLAVTSDFITAREGDETDYSKTTLAYQLTLWIASDPVDTFGYRRGGGSLKQNVRNSTLTIKVVGYDSGDAVTETLVDEDINYFDTSRRFYLTQETKKFLRFRSPIFRVSDDATTKLKIEVTGNYLQGVYFDDIVLTSYAYSPIIRVNTGDATINQTTTTVIIPGGLVNNGNKLVNPEFIDSRSSFLFGEFQNLLSNSSFEIGLSQAQYDMAQSWDGAACRASYYGNIGNARTGNFLLFMDDPTTDSVYQTVSIDYTNNYVASIWHKANPNFEAGNPATAGDVELKVETLTSGDAVVATYSATGIGGGSWTALSVTVTPTGSPTVTKARVTITCTAGSSEWYGACVDDASLYVLSQQTSGWYALPAQLHYGSDYPTLDYNTKDNMIARPYTKSGDTTLYHNVSSLRERILGKKASLEVVDYAYSNRYWNTEDHLYSDLVAVTPGNLYQMTAVLGWLKNTTGSDNIDALFSTPYLMNYSTIFDVPYNYTWVGPVGYTDIGDGQYITYGTIKVMEYGNLQIKLRFLDTDGNVLTSFDDMNISRDPYYSRNFPYCGQLFSDTFKPNYDPVSGLFYSNGLQSPTIVAPAGATHAQIYITSRGTNCGVRSVKLTEFVAKADVVETITSTFEGLTAGNTVQIYTFSNQIKVERADLDESGGWLLHVRDGIFERPYTVTTYESSGSLLKKLGYPSGAELRLIYTVPEFNLEPRFNYTEHLNEVFRVPCQPLDENSIYLGNQNILSLSELRINHTVVASGASSGSVAFTTLPLVFSDIAAVDGPRGTVSFTRKINEQDVFDASYIYREDTYRYRGYYDKGVWHDLDLNPGAGHRYHVDEDGVGVSSNTLINNGVTLYLLPTAAYPASGDSSGNYVFKSCSSMPLQDRPTHYLRHMVGVNVDEVILAQHPYAVILAKVFVLPPCSLGDLEALDLRPRGGGSVIIETPDFVQEIRCRVPANTDEWSPTHVDLYDGDVVTINGFGASSGALGTVSITPSGSLWGVVANTQPSSSETGFHVGTSYVWTVTSSSSGLLFLRVFNPDKAYTGELYARIQVRRKYIKKGTWDNSSWDGDPVMLNGVVVVEIDKRVLTGEDGFRQLTAEEVDEAVKQHVAAGVLPLISYR